MTVNYIVTERGRYVLVIGAMSLAGEIRLQTGDNFLYNGHELFFFYKNV